MQFLIDIILTLVYFFAFFLVCTWSWRFWMMYINQKYLNRVNDDMIMLEIKLPRDIMKSPVAMEVVLSSLLQGGGLSSWYAKYFQGNLPIYSSLEIASLEGIIHFYIRAEKKFRTLIESNLYAQYPGIEIFLAEDYTKLVQYTHTSKNVALFGENYKLTAEWIPVDFSTGESYKAQGEDYKMRADFFPIKTYVDYGLDKDPKEELKIDPITPLLEFMGSVGKGEYVWYQILVQDESVYNDKKHPKLYVNQPAHKHMNLREMATAWKTQMRTTGFNMKGDLVYGDYGEIKQRKTGTDENGKDIMENVTYMYEKPKAIPKREIELLPEEKELIEKVNYKLSKPLACAVIRMLYIAKTDVGKFNPAFVQNVLAFPKPFAGINSPGFLSVTNPYEYPWQNIGGRRSAWRGEEKFEEYVEREGFFPHIPDRKSLTEWEDRFFWNSSMKNRKMFRMIYEAIFHPFDHPHAEEVSTYNLEELATIWHLPGQVAATPTLPRIDSVKGVAPTNLPL